MFKRLITRAASVSTRATVIGALLILVAVSAVAWLLTQGRSEANASTAIQPYAARLDRVDGSVGIARVEGGDRQPDWTEATVNTPVTIGDRVYVRDRSRASIALTGHDYVQLNPATSLDLLSLEARRTQLALRSGSALFDVGELSSGELYEVATPCGAVDFQQPGLYQVGIDGGNAIISVLSGLAQVVGEGGTGTISKGQVFTLVGAASTQALASSLAPDLAGSIVDSYYHTRYSRVYDGRYRSYDAYLADPFYYDPYRSSQSCRYLSADVPGIYDLDDYGDWVDVSDYGYCWAPRVSAGWAPFRFGYWDLDDVWGPSWVSSEAWGWAPYHYGRWAFVNERWLWVPVEVRTRPAYSPAAVAFIPFADQVAWVPLGPGEVYVPRYYDVNFRPRYLASAQVINVVNVQRTFVNFNAPGGVTVVPTRALTRVIDPTVITPIDAGVVARSRAVLDPFSVERIRQLAVNREDARRKIRFAQEEQAALNAPVVATVAPPASVRADMGTALNVQAVPTGKLNKLKISDSGQVTSFSRPDGLPQPLGQSQRQSQMAVLAARAEQGDKSARREMRQLMQEEMRAPQQQSQSVGQEQSRQQMKEQRRMERQQQSAAQQQAAQQTQQQQIRQQRRAERQQQAASSVAPQDQTRRVQREQMRQQQQRVLQQEQTSQQRKEQKRLERRPPEASVQQQQLRQFEQARSQRAQQAAVVQAQAAQQREQAKAQRHIEQQRQAVMQQQSVQATQRQPAERAPVYQNPAAQQNAGPQSQRKAEKAQHRSSQF